MRSWILLVSIVAPLVLGGVPPTSSSPSPSADYHVHVPSDTAAEFINTHWGYDVAPKTADEVIAMLDEAQIEKGVLLSLGYMYGRPGTEVSNEYAKVQRENDYVADRAAKYPGRLVAFCSVNPLANYAMDEIERCAREEHLEGLKLQLGNSKVNLRDSSHVRELATIFSAANRQGLPIVIHLWTEAEYDRKDVEIFIRDVLPEASQVSVQIAHMGGAGLFSGTTAQALEAFTEAIERNRAHFEGVVFDLGAVTADPDEALANGDTSHAERYRDAHRQVARWIREIGPERVVFGSDYFARSIPDYVETLRSLPLEESVLRRAFANRAPYLQ